MIAVVLLLFIIVLPCFGEASVETGGLPTLDRALQFLDGRNPTKALSVLSVYRPEPEGLSPYHQTYARALEGTEKFHDALAHYRLAFIYAADGPAREQALLSRADLLMRMRNYPEAIIACKVFLASYRDGRNAGPVHLRLAEALYRVGRYAEAHAHYRMAGNSPVALSGRAKALHSLGRVREASDIFQSLLENDRAFLRSSQETVYLMGENLRLLGKLPEAKLYLGTIIEKPWKQWAERSLALIAAEEGNTETALKLLKSAAMSSDRKLRPLAVLGLGELSLKYGKTDEARARFMEIRNGYPFGSTYDRAILNLSRIYRSEGQTKESERLLNELVYRLNPPKEALDEMQALLVSLADKDRSELARLWRSSGRRFLDPERSEALLAIARGLRPAGRPSLELYDWLLKYGSPEAKTKSRLAMADLYADLGAIERASLYLNGAKLGGSSNDLLRVEARVSLAKGEYQKSLSALRSLKELTEEDLTVLADLAGPLGRDKAFIDFFGRSLDAANSGWAHHLRFAEVAAAAGRRSEALDHYAAAVSLQEKGKGKGDDDRKWCFYRLARLSSGPEAVSALNKIQSGTDVLSRYSRAALKEALVAESMERIF